MLITILALGYTGHESLEPVYRTLEPKFRRFLIPKILHLIVYLALLPVLVTKYAFRVRVFVLSLNV